MWLAIAAAAPAQILDLDDAPAFPETPVSVLDEVAASLTASLPAINLDTDRETVRSAGITLRRVIAELAVRGRGSGDGDAAAALTALRLAAGIEGIERRLERFGVAGSFTGNPPLRLDEDARRRGLDRLKVFSRSALEELRRRPTDSIPAFDDAISVVLAPIVDALEIMERHPLADRWPQTTEVSTGGVMAVMPTLPPLPDRDGLERLDQRLRSGGEDADRALHRSFRDAAAAAAGLSSERAATAIVLATLDACANESGLSLRRHVEALELATAIAADIEAIATSRARQDADPDALASLLSTTIASGVDERTILLLGRQRTTVGLIAAGADVDLDAMDRDLRVSARAVQKRHRRIVRSTVATLLKIGADPEALGDPDAVGAMQALEGSIDDLARLRVANELTSRMTSIRPGAIREFRRRIREWCLMLGDDATQAEGAGAIDAIARDLDRYGAMPAETWLISGGPVVIDRTGGRGVDVLNLLTETRRRWADEISNGELNGPARGELDRLARLGDLLMALDAVLVDGENDVAEGLAACDRWGGWFVAADRLAWTARQLAPALRAACAAAAAEDHARLEKDLARLERIAPPAAVVAWLAEHVGRPLEHAPTGSIGIVAAAAIPPERDAWGLSHRPALARICRAFAEIESARVRDDGVAVEKMTAWVIAACDDLLDVVRMTKQLGPRDRD